MQFVVFGINYDWFTPSDTETRLFGALNHLIYGVVFSLRFVIVLFIGMVKVSRRIEKQTLFPKQKGRPNEESIVRKQENKTQLGSRLEGRLKTIALKSFFVLLHVRACFRYPQSLFQLIPARKWFAPIATEFQLPFSVIEQVTYCQHANPSQTSNQFLSCSQ